MDAEEEGDLFASQDADFGVIVLADESQEPSLEVEYIFLWQDVMVEQNVQVFSEVANSPPGSPTSPPESPEQGWLQVEGFSDCDMEIDSPNRLVGPSLPLQPKVQIQFSL